jgi:pilus assembly protein Flp/PilA
MDIRFQFGWKEVKRMLLSLYVRLQALRNEEGASAVEYGLLVALIAVVIIAAVTALGISLDDIFSEVADAID